MTALLMLLLLVLPLQMCKCVRVCVRCVVCCNALADDLSLMHSNFLHFSSKYIWEFVADCRYREQNLRTGGFFVELPYGHAPKLIN